MKEKTIREWLEELPDGYRERALENYDHMYDSVYPIDGLSDAILDAFLWGGSPEGFEFWNDVIDWSIGEGNLPPLPEEEE